MLMYSAGDQLFACAGFTYDQARGVRRSDVHNPREAPLQGGRGTTNLLKHEGLMDLLPECEVVVVKPISQMFDFFECLFELGSCDTLFGDIHRRANEGHK